MIVREFALLLSRISCTCPVEMSLLKYFSRKRHRLEPDEEAGSSDDGSQVVAESTRNEASEGNGFELI